MEYIEVKITKILGKEKGFIIVSRWELIKAKEIFKDFIGKEGLKIETDKGVSSFLLFFGNIKDDKLYLRSPLFKTLPIGWIYLQVKDENTLLITKEKKLLH